MKDSFSILPFLIFMVSISLLILIAWSLILIQDFRKMRQENQEGEASIWFRRPVTRVSLKWIGFALLMLLLAFGVDVTEFLPRDLSTVSLTSIVFVITIGSSAIANSSSISYIRKVQEEHREDFLFVWYRQPKIIRWIGQRIFWCVPVLVIGYLEYGIVTQYVLHHSFPNPYPFIFVPCLFFLLSIALFVAAIFLEIRNKRP